MSDNEWQMIEAGKLTVNHGLEIAPGETWEIGDVHPSPERSGGVVMVEIESLPLSEGVCKMTVPATLPLKARAL